VSWINNVVPPKIRSFLTTKKDTPENLWVKCPDSGQLVFHKDLENNLFVVPGSLGCFGLRSRRPNGRMAFRRVSQAISRLPKTIATTSVLISHLANHNTLADHRSHCHAASTAALL